VGFPLRAFLLPEPCQQRIGLTPLRDERYGKVAALVSGRVLDVACGDNTLVQSWLRPRGHRCVGLDKLRKDPDVVGDASWLPFRPGAFDSVAIVAAINHVPRRQREQCLVDVRRVLRRNGTLVVTMIGPFIGRLCHALTWWDPWPVHDRAEEDQGLRAGEVTTLAQAAGFQLVRKERFLYGLNTAFLFRKR
jgi:SAM-dependent methyltransferase